MNFKVGDWIKTPKRGIFKVKNEIELSSWEIALDGKAELWQPKVGELVVSKVNSEEFLVHKYNPSFNRLTEVEPYIGELPSFIKDKE